MRVADVYFCETVVEWPQVGNGWSAMHHDDQTSFSTEEIDEQLEESIDREGLVYVAEGVDPEGDFERGQRGPRSSREDGYEDEDTNDMALEERLAVVLCLEYDGSRRRTALAGCLGKR